MGRDVPTTVLIHVGLCILSSPYLGTRYSFQISVWVPAGAVPARIDSHCARRARLPPSTLSLHHARHVSRVCRRGSLATRVYVRQWKVMPCAAVVRAAVSCKHVADPLSRRGQPAASEHPRESVASDRVLDLVRERGQDAKEGVLLLARQLRLWEIVGLHPAAQ